MNFYFEAGAAQHCLDTGPVGYPPVGRVVRVALLDEVKLGKCRIIEQILPPEMIVGLKRSHLAAAALHGLEHQQIVNDVLTDEIQRQQWVAQMVEHPHE